MATTASALDAAKAAAAPGVSPWISVLLATACGLVVANIYYAQPLAGPISAALGMSPAAAGLIVTLTQLGYGAGLLLIVPLADLLENRRLVVGLVGLSGVALLGAAFAGQPGLFLAAALLIGIGSVAVQVLVPYAAHLAPEESRGRAVGNVMSGLMLGIMLARPVASFGAQLWSWRMVFVLSAAVMAVLALVLRATLPVRVPEARLGYGALLASMGQLVVETPVLRRRALYHAGLFAALSVFWTVTPLLLAGPAFGLSQGSIALFALAGAAGVVAAPIAGRLADRGWSRVATGLAMAAVALSFVMTHVAPMGSSLSLGLLVAAAILLDFGVTTNVVLGQRVIYGLGGELRGRLNGIYMATFFAAGAAGSAVGAWAFSAGGWPLASWIGIGLPVASLLYFATERTPR